MSAELSIILRSKSVYPIFGQKSMSLSVQRPAVATPDDSSKLSVTEFFTEKLKKAAARYRETFMEYQKYRNSKKT